TGLGKLKTVLESQPATASADGSREFLLQYYNQTAENLKNAVAGLNEAQLKFSPAKDKWSIAQCLEHIVAAEKMLFAMGQKEMEKPAQPALKSEVKTSDADLIKGVTDRTEKFKAPKELQPSGKYTSAEIALADFTAGRQPVLDYIKSADLNNLRDHISDFPTGKVDGYQSLLLLAAHSARHTKQIEEVKANPGFPKE
ncbi:MAG TPA: DinB family protein, partial [Chitinophaga sp.]|nr:DinB family protein [Chitinophaga sp.]